jgi:NodT family efflux transporter outer membrane factor (OMF) lipoprotein
LNASWEPDVWGSVGRQVEASVAFAQSSYAALALARLSAQASLAQFYFELRTVDADQKLLDQTVRDYQQALRITKNRYNAGISALSDVAQARSQLETAEANAINNKINRAQYEHAIAVLIGVPPANFIVESEPLRARVPRIPLEIPSQLLERRPDIAQQERLMAQANANIGVAIATFYPTVTLTGSGTMTHSGFYDWINLPNAGWSLAASLADQIVDGGLRSATVAAARDTYDANVATYRQTVLTAFQNVEDNLASLKYLEDQETQLVLAAKDAQQSLQIIMNEYKAGTVTYTDVITAQNTAFSAEKAAVDVKGLQFSSAVGLIKGLGGGWDTGAMAMAPVTGG